MDFDGFLRELTMAILLRVWISLCINCTVDVNGSVNDWSSNGETELCSILDSGSQPNSLVERSRNGAS